MIGNSLLVLPANLLHQLAKQSGAKIIFINREKTIMDNIADMFIKGSGGESLKYIIKRITS